MVEEEGTRISVRMPNAVVSDFAASVAGVASVNQAPAQASKEAPAASGAEDAVDRPLHWKPIIAPMVGTFYTAPAPGEPPFVKVGDDVSATQTICIVEAMKLMNEISAEEVGIIREVCLDDATPVEFGTVLFYLEPFETQTSAPETA